MSQTYADKKPTVAWRQGEYFMGECVAPLWSMPDNLLFIAVKIGAFDDGSNITPNLHIYVESAPS